MVQEIGRLEVKFLARDNTGAKNIALFLEEIASSLPETILSYVPLLLPHLDGESYLIRNGIVRLLGQVIEKAFCKDAEQAKTPAPSKKVGRKTRHEGESSEEEVVRRYTRFLVGRGCSRSWGYKAIRRMQGKTMDKTKNKAQMR